MALSTTSTSIYNALASLGEEELPDGLTFPLLLGAAACIDAGAAAGAYATSKVLKSVAENLKSNPNGGHVLLNMIHFAKWKAVETICLEVSQDKSADNSFENNSHLKTIYEIASTQAKWPPGDAMDSRSTTEQPPPGLFRRLKAQLNRNDPDDDPTPDDFTKADRKLLNELQIFVSREAQDQSNGVQAQVARLCDSVAGVCADKVLDDLFAITRTFGRDEKAEFGVPAFLERFNDPKHGWAATYRVHLKGQLQDPENEEAGKRLLLAFGAETLKSTMWTGAIVEGMEGRLATMQELFSGFDSKLSDILTRLTHELTLDPVGTGSTNEQFNKLVFVSRQTTFSGRDEEMNRLDAFMVDECKVLWWQVAGKGGQGKSRLALELIDKYREGWHTGFLLTDDFPPLEKWNNIAVNRPTLCVIDYVASPAKAKAAAQALVALQRRQNELSCKIRFLFIERAPFSFEDKGAEEALWFDIFKRKGKVQTLRKTVFDLDGPVMLNTLGDDAMCEIANSWRKFNDKTTLNEKQLQALLGLLSPTTQSGEVRERAGRPLFAMIFADLVANGNDRLTDDLPNALKRTLADEKNTYWQDNDGGLIDPRASAVNLASLATIVGRLPLNHPALNREEGRFYSPHDSKTLRQAWMVLGRRLSDPLATNDPDALPLPLAGREPDLLGEYMLYWLLGQAVNQGQAQRVDSLMEDAWEIDEVATMGFLLRLAEDADDLNVRSLFKAFARRLPPESFLEKVDPDQNVILASYNGLTGLLHGILPEANHPDAIILANGVFPLFVAAQEGHTDIVNTLLCCDGIDVNKENRENGAFPLLMAAQNGHTETIKALICCDGIDVNKEHTKVGIFPLLQAAQNGHTETVEALLCHVGIDAGKENRKNGAFPLLMAAQNGHTEIVEALLCHVGIDAGKENRKNGAFPLLMAAQNGHIETVKALLDHDGIDVNKEDRESGSFPLLMAAQNGHTDIVRALLDHDGIDTGKENRKNGIFPLLMAAQNGHTETVKAFLDHDGIDASKEHREAGAFPLLMAAQEGHTETVKALLDHDGIDVNKENRENGIFPLSMAAQEGHTETVKALLCCDGIDVNKENRKNGIFPLLMAAQNDHTETVKALLDHDRIDASKEHRENGTFPLLMAAQEGHTETVKALLDLDGIEVNKEHRENGTFPLFMAAQNGHIETVKALLDHDGIDVNKEDRENGTFSLLQAAQEGHTETVKALLDHDRIDASKEHRENGTFTLLIAAQEGHTETVKALLDLDGIDVNKEHRENGTFPLFMAAQEGHTETVKALLDHDGIDVNKEDRENGTFSLLQAAQEGHTETVKALLGHDGIDVNKEHRENGIFPLSIATQQGHTNTVKALLSCDGIDVNKENGENRAFPLIMAGGKGHLPIVRLLIQNGADINKVHALFGGTATDYAESFDQEEVVFYLKQKGGRIQSDLLDDT